MKDHPGREELFAFAAGRLPRERAAEVVSHIARGCQSCREEAARVNLRYLRQVRESRAQASVRVDDDGGRPALTEIRLPLLEIC